MKAALLTLVLMLGNQAYAGNGGDPGVTGSSVTNQVSSEVAYAALAHLLSARGITLDPDQVITVMARFAPHMNIRSLPNRGTRKLMGDGVRLYSVELPGVPGLMPSRLLVTETKGYEFVDGLADAEKIVATNAAGMGTGIWDLLACIEAFCELGGRKLVIDGYFDEGWASSWRHDIPLAIEAQQTGSTTATVTVTVLGRGMFQRIRFSLGDNGFQSEVLREQRFAF